MLRKWIRMLLNEAKKVLVLCTGNSCRSQMAEGYLRHYAGVRAEIYSAGVEVHGMNARAIAVMKDDNIDISGHHSKHVSELDHISFDYIITVCDHARETCPYMASGAIRIHHSFEDPSRCSGTEKEIRQAFTDCRDQIKLFSQEFVATYLMSEKSLE